LPVGGPTFLANRKELGAQASACQLVSGADNRRFGGAHSRTGSEERLVATNCDSAPGRPTAILCCPLRLWSGLVLPAACAALGTESTLLRLSIAGVRRQAVQAYLSGGDGQLLH